MPKPDEEARHPCGKKRVQSRVSQSFSEDELNAADELVRAMLRGGDPSQVTRRPGFASLATKFAGMKARIAEQKRAKENASE